jgi:acetyl-CoA carboxylase carboxyl transferase subunit beta
MAIFKSPVLSVLSSRRREMPEGLWVKCPSCGELIHRIALTENLEVCPKCGYHFTLGAKARIAQTVDPGTFKEMDADMVSTDPLKFQGVASYEERLRTYREKTGLKDAVITGSATLKNHPVGIAVMDFNFLAASLGSVVGEKITRVIEHSTAEKKAVLIFSASGGARMYESMLSLMQMAKTSGALARHSKAGLPFISILTNPTMAGVMASYASLGDVIVAEPGAMIGFAGPRVIRETTHQDLPPGFQTAEFLEKHGLVDIIVPRNQMREQLGLVLDYLAPGRK